MMVDRFFNVKNWEKIMMINVHHYRTFGRKVFRMRGYNFNSRRCNLRC